MIKNEKKTKMKNMQPLHLHKINLYINISMTTLHQLTISRSILNLSFNFQKHLVPLHGLFCVFICFVRVVKFVYVLFISVCCDLWNSVCLVWFLRKHSRNISDCQSFSCFRPQWSKLINFNKFNNNENSLLYILIILSL